MTTIDEVFETMAADDSVTGLTNELLIIDPDTRQISVPGIELTFGVEGDAGSERKCFQCPRYVGDGVDMAASFLRINYRNANGETDSYLVDDVTVDGENVLFSWRLSNKVLDYKGQVKFVVCVVGPDLKLKWHTTLGTGISLEGLEPDESVVTSGTADVVAQLISMVEAQTGAVQAVGEEWVASVESTGETWVSSVSSEGATQVAVVKSASEAAEAASVAEIEAKGVNALASIPADYTALSEAVDTLARGKAPGIVCEAAGTAVVANDSAEMPMQGLRIFGRTTQDGTPTPENPVELVSVTEPVVRVTGKNYLTLPYHNGSSRTHNGITYTVQDDGGVRVSGTLTSGESYFVLADIDFGSKSVGKNQTNGTYFWSNCLYNVSRHYTMIYYSNPGTYDELLYPQVELGMVATEYEHPASKQTVEIARTLPGIPVTSGGNYTDSEGQQWICDEVDLERGVYVQRINQLDISPTNPKTFIGSDDYIYYPMGNHSVYGTKSYCTHFENIGFNSSGASAKFDGFSTVEEFNAFATNNAIKLVCVLATPNETSLTETELAAYRVLHSNYPNTTVLNSAGAHMVVKYAADTKLYIDNKIAALTSGV